MKEVWFESESISELLGFVAVLKTELELGFGSEVEVESEVEVGLGFVHIVNLRGL
jgi:hypothetical protein